jgi:hypothetical protein
VNKVKTEVVKHKCIWCGKAINENSAYMSKSDNQFDGRMIWCKNCVNEQYKDYYGRCGDIARALFLACRKFDLPYLPNKLDMALNQLKDEEYSAEKVLSIYMTKLYFKHNLGDPICFDHGVTEIMSVVSSDDVAQEMVLKWIPGLSTEDYEFLECELADWQKTHSCDNKAELTLLKHICLKELEIRKMQADHQDTSKALKDLQDLMKTANVDPAKANAASAGKSAECYGVWLKDFEEKEPAEWFEDQEKFKDMDGLWNYIKNYIIRPIKNFFTGSRDFIVDDGLDSDLDSVDVGGEQLDGS